MTIEKLKSVFIKKGYVWNEYINVIGVRNKTVGDKITNKFDDTLYLAYKEAGTWKLKEWVITTDPGKYYMQNPLNSEGCAILVEGQYLNIYSIRKHQGKYDALCQTYGPVKLYRDRDKDDTYDFINIKNDNAGINIHKAGIDSSEIGNHSAGCNVFKRDANFNEFMTILNQYKSQLGNKFTYTLLNSNDTI